MNKIEYVLGLMFNEEKDKVLLIHKNRPDFQKGKLNGIGGKIETRKLSNVNVRENPLDAMVREFYEETGFYWDSWDKFCELSGDNYDIEIFKAFGDITKAMTVTDEEVCIVEVDDLPKNVMSNLNWLIPMALENKLYLIEEL